MEVNSKESPLTTAELCMRYYSSFISTHSRTLILGELSYPKIKSPEVGDLVWDYWSCQTLGNWPDLTDLGFGLKRLFHFVTLVLVSQLCLLRNRVSTSIWLIFVLLCRSLCSTYVFLWAFLAGHSGEMDWIWWNIITTSSDDVPSDSIHFFFVRFQNVYSILGFSCEIPPALFLHLHFA